VEAASIPVHPLGQILVDQGLVSAPVLEDAIFEQQLTGRRLGAILVEQGALSAADLAAALADQFGIELTSGPPVHTPRRRGHLRLVQPNELPENVIELPLRREEPFEAAEVHAIRKSRLAYLEAILGRAIASAAREQHHVLFVPGSEGYGLVERDGPPPALGQAFDLDGTPVTVAKLGRSPFPGDRRPCAYLERT
jgi:hypothetical protein